MRKISFSNFTHLNKIKWRIFIPVQKAWYVKKIARGGWSGFGKALTWDPSQMITCHPKKIPKFLLKGGVVQFCLWNLPLPQKITQNDISPLDYLGKGTFFLWTTFSGRGQNMVRIKKCMPFFGPKISVFGQKIQFLPYHPNFRWWPIFSPCHDG